MRALGSKIASAQNVTNLSVSFADKPIFTAETTIANSADPNFRFYFTPRGSGALKAEVKDSRGQTFTASLEVAPR